MVCSKLDLSVLAGITCRGPDVLAHLSSQSPRAFPQPGQSSGKVLAIVLCPGHFLRDFPHKLLP